MATKATTATLALTAWYGSRDNYFVHVQILSKVSAFGAYGFNGRARHDGLNGHDSYNNYDGHGGHDSYDCHNSHDSYKGHDGHNVLDGHNGHDC